MFFGSGALVRAVSNPNANLGGHRPPLQIMRTILTACSLLIAFTTVKAQETPAVIHLGRTAHPDLKIAETNPNRRKAIGFGTSTILP